MKFDPHLFYFISFYKIRYETLNNWSLISLPQLSITSRWLIFPNMPNYSLWTFNISFWNKYFMYVWISLDLFSIILIRMRKYHFIGFTCIWFSSNEKAFIHLNSILEFLWPCFIHCKSLLCVCTNFTTKLFKICIAFWK